MLAGNFQKNNKICCTIIRETKVLSGVGFTNSTKFGQNAEKPGPFGQKFIKPPLNELDEAL